MESRILYRLDRKHSKTTIKHLSQLPPDVETVKLDSEESTTRMTDECLAGWSEYVRSTILK